MINKKIKKLKNLNKKIQNITKDQEDERQSKEENIKVEKEVTLDDLKNEGDQNELNLNFFSTEKFQDLEINSSIKKGIKDILGHEYMTHIQAKTIHHLLKGRDVIGAAKTGSGKTLAFLIPALELLQKIKFAQRNGTGVLIISPTRELAQQIYDVCTKLLTFHNRTHGLIIGGSNKKFESIKIQNGINILIATPGRLLDHLLNTKEFKYDNLKMLIIDEADQILKKGFEEEMNEIFKILPTQRQTVLFSATQTQKVEDLIKTSMKDPIFVEVKDKNVTVESLEQGFVLCQPELRFRLLFTFLKRNQNKKIMVFFSSCNSVKFHSDVLNYVDVRALDIHGKQKQQKRLNTFYEFNNLKSGVLLCTDVAARGLDIPNVDWIVQFDPPDDVKEYIHRVGRTCRGANSKGKALLFLLPQEVNFLKYLQRDNVSLNEYEFPESKLADIQKQYQKLVENNYFLYNCAKQAYKSYLHAYMSHQLKDVFEVKELDLQKAAYSFGLTVPPRVDLDISLRQKKNQKNKFQQKKQNFLDKRRKDNGDHRQFSR